MQFARQFEFSGAMDFDHFYSKLFIKLQKTLQTK
jgi:hypothetical protein